MRSIEQKIIKQLQGDIPLIPAPFRAIGKKLGLSEKELLAEISVLKRKGALRSVRAIVRHTRAGYTANAMVVWKVPGGRVLFFGRTAAASPAVSHCYERFSPAGWPYNLYTMIHARSRGEILRVIERLKRKTGVKEFKILESVREFKKTSMVYY